MKKTLLILTTIIALTGCVSTKTYSTYVTEKLEQQIHAPDIQDKNISFDFSKLEVLDNSVEAEKSNLSQEFIFSLTEAIHIESIQHQSAKMNNL